jgi:hypothetical protein
MTTTKGRLITQNAIRNRAIPENIKRPVLTLKLATS